MQIIELQYNLKNDTLRSFRALRGPTPFFKTNFGHNYHFLFLGEKVSSGI